MTSASDAPSSGPRSFPLEPPRFDASLGAWVLTTYADVSAALRDPRLSDSAPAPLFDVRADAAPSVAERFSALACDDVVDLVQDLAAPWALDVARSCLGLSRGAADDLAACAHDVFLAAAHATSAEPSPSARDAVSKLSGLLSAGRDAAPLDVQSFVALSQTLPCLLGSVWHALIAHPDQACLLRAEPSLLPGAIEELLRFAGPSRAVFRRVHEETVISDATLAADDRIIVGIESANRDPSRFSNPDALDVRRNARGHLAFGRGTHGCVGASLVRSRVHAATAAMLSLPTPLERAADAEWIGGFAIQGVWRLPVVMSPS